MRFLHRWSAASAVLVLGTAFAVSAQFSDDDGKCRAAIARGVRKLAAVQLKATDLCHKDRMLGLLSPTTECNDSAQLPAIYRTKVLRARQKLIDKAATGCAAASPPPVLGYVGCGLPCLSVAVPDYAGVGNCLACLTRDRVRGLVTTAYGQPASPAYPPEAVGCQKLIGKGVRKYFGSRMQQQHACQKLVDLTKILPTNCLDLSPAAPGSPVGKMVTKLADAEMLKDEFIAGCDDIVDIGLDLASCGGTEALEQACIGTAADATADDLFNLIYFPPPPPTLTPTLTRTATPTRTPTATPVLPWTPSKTPTHPLGSTGTIYVSNAVGNDGNSGGSRNTAKKTIQAAINIATTGKRICIDGGLYEESLTLKSGIIIEGGFDASLNWAKTYAPTVIQGGETAVFGNSIADTVIRDLQIYSATATGSGFFGAKGSYGVRLILPSNVVIENCEVHSGNGATGQAGAGGAAGMSVGTTPDGGHVCSAGGVAGAGGDFDPCGEEGQDGSGGAVGGFGGGCNKVNGGAGEKGDDGADGFSGFVLGSFPSGTGTYAPLTGASGSAGDPGAGGGGGGSVPGAAGSGGAGGVGGCGGHLGQGGKGGGAAVGIVIAGGSASVIGTLIGTGNGGTGGAGGIGGYGEFGGVGGFSPNPLHGGNGGNGGLGGRGGHGQGGPGGPSIGVVCTGIPAPTVELAGNFHQTEESGAGGAGVGFLGLSGFAADTYGCAP